MFATWLCSCCLILFPFVYNLFHTEPGVNHVTLVSFPFVELKAYDDGYYLTCVWCAMTWKWGFLLFYYSRQYFRSYKPEYASLVKESDDSEHGYGSWYWSLFSTLISFLSWTGTQTHSCVVSLCHTYTFPDLIAIQMCDLDLHGDCHLC